jgi:hypothetical protein
LNLWLKIIIGLSIGEEKPHFDLFLNPLIAQLKRLEYGVKIKLHNSSLDKIVKIFLVAAIFDKPAKAAVLNMKSSNGFYGCTKCLQPGISHREHKDGMIIISF